MTISKEIINHMEEMENNLKGYIQKNYGPKRTKN